MAGDLRSQIFSALTGRDADVSGKTDGDVRGMLMAIGGPSDRTRSGIDLTKAAKAAGVSRRTAERWVAAAESGAGQRPSPRHLKTLSTKARQAASTKQGRRAALADARQKVANGVRLSLTGMQGPSTKDYFRPRTTRLDLDPAETAAMLDAWEKGGEKGFMTWVTDRWGGDRQDNYVDDWQFGDMDDIDIQDL